MNLFRPSLSLCGTRIGLNVFIVENLLDKLSLGGFFLGIVLIFGNDVLAEWVEFIF